MTEDMETIPVRVNDLEKMSHTHEHRITQLEQLPPRVAYIESTVNAMSVKITHMEALSAGISEKQDQVLRNQTEQSAQHSTTMKNIALLCTVLGGIAVVMAWIA